MSRDKGIGYDALCTIHPIDYRNKMESGPKTGASETPKICIIS